MGAEASQLPSSSGLESDQFGEPQSEADIFLRTVFGSVWKGTFLTALVRAETPKDIPRLADKERRYVLSKHISDSVTAPLFWPRSEKFSKVCGFSLNHLSFLCSWSVTLSSLNLEEHHISALTSSQKTNISLCTGLWHLKSRDRCASAFPHFRFLIFVPRPSRHACLLASFSMKFKDFGLKEQSNQNKRMSTAPWKYLEYLPNQLRLITNKAQDWNELNSNALLVDEIWRRNGQSRSKTEDTVRFAIVAV